MAGSRKGERRGGRRKGTPPTTPPEVAAIGKSKAVRKKVHAPKRTEEYYREITRVINGSTAADIEPREVMLEAMRFFHGKANEEKSLMVDMARQLGRCTTDTQFAMMGDLLAASELRVREMYLLAVDCGFKVAPYVHAKLSSMEITGPDKAPIEIIGTLLHEIAEANRGRPTWMPETLELEAERIE